MIEKTRSPRIPIIREIGGIRAICVALITLVTTAMQQVDAAQVMVAYKNYLIPINAIQPPSSLTAVAAMSYNKPRSTAILTWDIALDADEYSLKHFDVASSRWFNIYVGPSNTYSVNDLPLGVHKFKVVACEAGACGGKSAKDSVTIVQNLDLDLDGVLDHNDLCLGSAEGATVSTAGCPPTTLDSDGDGVTDDLDWCNGANTTSTAINSGGCTPDQIDSDDDGTADYLDSYPYQNDSQCTP